MKITDRMWVAYSAWGCVAAALLHVVAILAGPDWFDFLGAPPEYGESLRRGDWVEPVVITLGIALVLLIWAAYAFSVLKRIRPLPFMKWALAIVAFIFIVRGALGIPIMLWVIFKSGVSALTLFHLAASIFVLTLGYGFWLAFKMARV